MDSCEARWRQQLRDGFNSPRQQITICENSTSQKAIVNSPIEALALTIDSLELLADLMHAHFVASAHPRLQQKAIKSARDLAKRYRRQQQHPTENYIIDLDYERLTRDLMMLKSVQLQTDNGLDWSNIMREPIRDIALGIKSYQPSII